MEILPLEMLALQVGAMVVWDKEGREDVISHHQNQLSKEGQGTEPEPGPNTPLTPQLCIWKCVS